MKHEWPIEHDNVYYLQKARDIIANGWCKYRAEDGQGNHCALGAIAVATPSKKEFVELLKILHSIVPRPFISIANFNDSPITIQVDVIALFERAIAHVREIQK
jgi:hypothetical protein